MLKSVFFRRLYVPYVITICVVAVVTGAIGAQRLHESHMQQARAMLSSAVAAVAHALNQDMRDNNVPAMQARVKELARAMGYRITVIGPDPKGTVLADSDADPATMSSHRYRPEVITAYTSGRGSDIRRSDTLHINLLYYAERIELDDKVAYVRLAVRLDDLESALNSFYINIALGVILCIAAASLFTYYVARRQAVAVVEMTRFADAISRLHLEHRILRREPGELGELSASLNLMAESLSRVIAEAQTDRAELLAVLSTMSEGIIATDAHRQIVLVNDAASRLLDFAHDTATGKAIWEVVPHEAIIKAVEEVAITRSRRQFITSLQPGQQLEVTVHPFLHRTTGREQPGQIVVVHDVTLAMRYDELRKEFVANVSHELRTPLTVIKGYVETLRDGAVDDTAKRDEYLATIERHANQLSNLVSDLLEISRLENQTQVPHRSEVDLCALARIVIDLLQPAILQKQHTVVTRLPDTPVKIIGNADYLERAIINLLDNAVKYTPPSGQITVSVFCEASSVIVEVADNGIGIPEEDLPRIFERFYRVDRSRSRAMGGTGLGLAIVKHIAQAHGGKVAVTSKVNSGSSFRIIFPLRAQT